MSCTGDNTELFDFHFWLSRFEKARNLTLIIKCLTLLDKDIQAEDFKNFDTVAAKIDINNSKESGLENVVRTIVQISLKANKRTQLFFSTKYGSISFSDLNLLLIHNWKISNF